MMDRTPHPEQPAEGTDTPAYTEENGSEESADAEDLVNDRPVLGGLPGGDTREPGDLAEADGVEPDAHVGLP